MKLLVPTTTVLLVLCGIAGCPNASNTSAPSSPMPTPVAMPVNPNSPNAVPANSNAIPASQATGIWNQGQVEQWLKQDLKLTGVTLSGTGNGNYTGQGRDATGTTFQLNVRQVPGGIVCNHTSGPGSSGRIAFGNPVPEPGQAIPVQTPVAVNPTTVQIPETPVSGKVHGFDFAIEKAVLENGVLTLRQGKDLFPDLALDVMMFLKQGEPAEGKKLQVAPDQAPGKPLLRLQWKEAGKLKMEHFPGNYSLVVELGRIQDGKLPGKIHVALPDQSKSSLSGTFMLEGVR